MLRIKFLLTVFFLPAIIIQAQDPDIISGETLKPEYLQNYLDNPVIRAKYNNDPFDNERSLRLRGNMPYVSGEILNPGQANVDELQVRTVVTREYFPGKRDREPVFKGAFQYTGYSLSDIIKDYIVSKNNKGEFGLNHDLYVMVKNDDGESAVFSWGELFLGTHNHDIIIATHVQPVFPTHSDDKWPLPDNTRLVASNDFLTVRNIDKPSMIIIRSFPAKFPGHKGLRPLFSPELKINEQGSATRTISDTEIPDSKEDNHELVFFGLHKGLRGIRDFKGVTLEQVLRANYDFSINELARGMIAIGAKDAYRAVFSLSEIMNRTDMAEVLLLDEPDNEDGRFIVHPGADFFADRHIKGASLAYIIVVNE